MISFSFNLRWQITKVLVASVFIAAFAPGYFFVGRVTHGAGFPSWVAMDVDAQIPFVPASVWFYLGGYFFFIWAPVLLLRDRDNFSRFMWSVAVATCICFMCYLLFPISYPRPLLDATGEIHDNLPLVSLSTPKDTLSIAATRWLYGRDPPTCTLPSFHVTEAVCAVLALRHERKAWSLPFIGAAITLAVTTWTTKQHFIVDTFAGLACGCTAHWVAFVGATVGPAVSSTALRSGAVESRNRPRSTSSRAA